MHEILNASVIDLSLFFPTNFNEKRYQIYLHRDAPVTNALNSNNQNFSDSCKKIHRVAQQSAPVGIP